MGYILIHNSYFSNYGSLHNRRFHSLWYVLEISLFKKKSILLGGLAAVIYTDTLQAFVLVIGASIVAALCEYSALILPFKIQIIAEKHSLALVEVGGYDAMVSQFMQAASRDTYVKSYQHGNASCGFPPSDSFHVFRGLDSSYPWPGLVLGLPVIGIFYWCTQQVCMIVIITCNRPHLTFYTISGHCSKKFGGKVAHS